MCGEEETRYDKIVGYRRVERFAPHHQIDRSRECCEVQSRLTRAATYPALKAPLFHACAFVSSFSAACQKLFARVTNHSLRWPAASSAP